MHPSPRIPLTVQATEPSLVQLLGQQADYQFGSGRGPLDGVVHVVKQVAHLDVTKLIKTCEVDLADDQVEVRQLVDA